MRCDLINALAAVDWADAHIPLMQERFIKWQRAGPYNIDIEPDPEGADRELLVAYLARPLDPLIYGDVGAIINLMRAALDILMSALLTGNGIKPNSKAHFPIRSTETEFLDRVAMLENKKWISADEAAAIKDTRAYEGGDDVLYRVHQLDIFRKHERFLDIEPIIQRAFLAADGPDLELILQHMDDKTILYRFPKGRFRPTKGNSQVPAEILLNEPSLGITRKPAIPTLRTFTSRIRALILNFP